MEPTLGDTAFPAEDTETIMKALADSSTVLHFEYGEEDLVNVNAASVETEASTASVNYNLNGNEDDNAEGDSEQLRQGRKRKTRMNGRRQYDTINNGRIVAESSATALLYAHKKMTQLALDAGSTGFAKK